MTNDTLVTLFQGSFETQIKVGKTIHGPTQAIYLIFKSLFNVFVDDNINKVKLELDSTLSQSRIEF